MEIKIKLFSTLKEREAKEKIAGCQLLKEEEGVYKLCTKRRVSVQEVLDAFNIKEEVMALVNGKEVPPQYMLVDQDIVSLFPCKMEE
jgi:molybdopterin converting factor small subunit